MRRSWRLTVKDTDASTVDEFADAAGANPTRVVIKERDRLTLEGNRRQLLIEVFVERGIEAKLATWRVDVRPPPAKTDPNDWRIERMEPVSNVAGLFRLALNATRQFDVRNLVVTGTDVTIEMTAGTAFVAEIPDGPTAIVLLGRGRMRFAPPDQAERTQIRLFTGADDLVSEFDAAFLRVRPSDFESRFRTESLVARPVVATDLRRATEVFDEYLSRTLQIDLTDLSRDRWSLVPSSGDLIAEVRTRRFGSLTYARSGNEAEDITVFDRRRRRNISIYASAEKLATRGRFYSEDDLVDYDVLAYEVDTVFSPDRYWINGTAHLRVRVRAGAMTTMTLKLAEAFTVRGVYAPGFGRLLHLRVVNQNSLIVNLPSPVFRDNEFTLTIVYSGRLEPSELDREAIALQSAQEREPITIPLEPRYIYSNNSFWYPQSTVSDYALGTLRVTVPTDYDVVATGTLTGPARPLSDTAATRGQKMFTFQNDRPVRYLSCVISRMSPVVSTKLPIRSSAADFGDLRVAVPDPTAPVPAGSRSSSSTSVAEPSAAAGTASDETSVTLDRQGQPAPGRTRAQPRRADERDPAVLRVDRRRSAVPDLYAGGDRKRAAWRPQPGVLRRAQSGVADLAHRLAQRSGELRELPAVLPGARARAPVVGTGRRVEELPRAVDQRGLRAVLRRAVRREGARRERLPVRAAADAALRHRHVAAGADPSRLPARPHSCRAPGLPLARVQQVGDRAAHAAATGRRRGVLLRRAALLLRVAVQEGRDRRFPRWRWKRRPDGTSGRSSRRGFTASRSRASPSPTARRTRTRSS